VLLQFGENEETLCRLDGHNLVRLFWSNVLTKRSLLSPLNSHFPLSITALVVARVSTSS
jgi:hypothetical protein